MVTSGSTFFRIVAGIGQDEIGSFEIGTYVLLGIASSLDDCVENSDSFHLLAQSASGSVRAAVASKDALRLDTITLLSDDPVADVRRSLCRSKAFREWADTDALKKLIKGDTECARELSSVIEQYSVADIDVIIKILVKHDDPDVRISLARNFGIQKKYLRELTGDADPTVASEARHALS